MVWSNHLLWMPRLYCNQCLWYLWSLVHWRRGEVEDQPCVYSDIERDRQCDSFRTPWRFPNPRGDKQYWAEHFSLTGYKKRTDDIRSEITRIELERIQVVTSVQRASPDRLISLLPCPLAFLFTRTGLSSVTKVQNRLRSSIIADRTACFSRSCSIS